MVLKSRRRLNIEIGLGGVVFGLEFARFDSFLLVFCSFLGRFGFVFFAFFWTIVIVSPYHSKCYRQSALLKIGFVWYIRVTSVKPFPCRICIR